jgi:hypothetical protein
MNERIRELAEQATTIVDTVNSQGYSSSYANFDREKFAELIVRECMQVAVFKDSGTVATAQVAGYMAAGRSISARLIKEHFGVEE